MSDPSASDPPNSPPRPPPEGQEAPAAGAESKPVNPGLYDETWLGYWATMMEEAKSVMMDRLVTKYRGIWPETSDEKLFYSTVASRYNRARAGIRRRLRLIRRLDAFYTVHGAKDLSTLHVNLSEVIYDFKRRYALFRAFAQQPEVELHPEVAGFMEELRLHSREFVRDARGEMVRDALSQAGIRRIIEEQAGEDGEKMVSTTEPQAGVGDEKAASTTEPQAGGSDDKKVVSSTELQAGRVGGKKGVSPKKPEKGRAGDKKGVSPRKPEKGRVGDKKVVSKKAPQAEGFGDKKDPQAEGVDDKKVVSTKEPKAAAGGVGDKKVSTEEPQAGVDDEKVVRIGDEEEKVAGERDDEEMVKSEKDAAATGDEKIAASKEEGAGEKLDEGESSSSSEDKMEESEGTSTSEGVPSLQEDDDSEGWCE